MFYYIYFALRLLSILVGTETVPKLFQRCLVTLTDWGPGQLPFRHTFAHHCLLTLNQTVWGPEDEFMISAKRSPGSGAGHRQGKGGNSTQWSVLSAGSWTHRGGHFLRKEQARFPKEVGDLASLARLRGGGRVFRAESNLHKADLNSEWLKWRG